MSPDATQLLLQLLLAAGGASGISTLVGVVLQRRKLKAEADKTGVDAGQVIVTTSLNLMEEMKQDNEELREEVDDLREYIDVLVHIMRSNGLIVPVPPRRRPRPSAAQ